MKEQYQEHLTEKSIKIKKPLEDENEKRQYGSLFGVKNANKLKIAQKGLGSKVGLHKLTQTHTLDIQW